MILTVFSALRLQGNGKDITSHRFVDSGAFNHMTGSPNSLHNLQKYIRTQNIQIAN